MFIGVVTVNGIYSGNTVITLLGKIELVVLLCIAFYVYNIRRTTTKPS